MNDKHLIIFVKNKIQGQVKTRLAAGIGPQKAMEIYELLLSHTHLVTRGLSAQKTVFFSPEAETDSIWGDGNFSLTTQAEGDLGKRMYEAFNELLGQGAGRVCIIGSDTFEISTQILRQAFEELKTKDIVLGPAQDGGYYLLGMKELQPELFSNKHWSTESVLSQTLEDIKRLNLRYSLLPLLNDIDHKEDWLAYRQKKMDV